MIVYTFILSSQNLALILFFEILVQLFGESFRKTSVRRVSSDSSARRRSVIEMSPAPSLLAVPTLVTPLMHNTSGSCRHLMSLTEIEPATQLDSPTEDEPTGPVVSLIPPPYPEQSTSPSPDSSTTQPTDNAPKNYIHPSDDVSYTSKSDLDIQIMVVEDTILVPDTRQESKEMDVRPVTPGQRVRIRLCDTRLDSGIGDDKHSQESQPSSSGQCEVSAETALNEVVVQSQDQLSS